MFSMVFFIMQSVLKTFCIVWIALVLLLLFLQEKRVSSVLASFSFSLIEDVVVYILPVFKTFVDVASAVCGLARCAS